jgi:hypothetical protein
MHCAVSEIEKFFSSTFSHDGTIILQFIHTYISEELCNEIEIDNDVINTLEEADVGFDKIYTSVRVTQGNEIDQNDKMADIEGIKTQSSNRLRVTNTRSSKNILIFTIFQPKEDQVLSYKLTQLSTITTNEKQSQISYM